MDSTFSAFFAALERNTPVALLAVTLIALAWLVRDSRTRDVAAAAALQAVNAKHDEEMREAFDAHLQTALQVAPLASRLVDCVAAVERLDARRGN